MAKIYTFKDLECWKYAHQLTIKIYQITNKFPQEELYGLTSQVRRSAVSVASNISEGFKRKNSGDKLRFFNIADASLAETNYQILLSYDLKYLSELDYQEIVSLINKTGRTLFGWIKSTKKHN